MPVFVEIFIFYANVYMCRVHVSTLIPATVFFVVSDRNGTDRNGQGRVGQDRNGSDRIGQDRVISIILKSITQCTDNLTQLDIMHINTAASVYLNKMYKSVQMGPNYFILDAKKCSICINLEDGLEFKVFSWAKIKEKQVPALKYISTFTQF